jgi:hypothetical protein
MRKQHDGLYALVVAELKADPLSEDLFLFTNRRRRFAPLWRRDEEESVEMTLSEPAFFLEGSTLAGAFRLTPPPTSRQVPTPCLHETQCC